MPRQEPITRKLGTFGSYQVTDVFEDYRFYIRKEYDDGSRDSIPLRKTRRDIHLRHIVTKARVIFSTYLHRGIVHYRDSREKESLDRLSVCNEISRMLGITMGEANAMIELYQKETL